MSEKKVDINLIPDNAITEISGKLYDDVAHKSLTQIGDVSEALMKLVFLPFKCLGMTIDELEMKYKSFIKKTINKIPPHKLIKPDTIIASKILEHVKYVFTEDILVEMFSNLLASDMNSDSTKDMHPSFVDTLCKMNSFDAKVILYICVNTYLYESTLNFYISKNHVAEWISFRDISMITPDIEHWNVSSIFLKSAGIISIEQEKNLNYERFREHLKKHGKYFKIPKIVKKVFNIKGKTGTKKKDLHAYLDMNILTVLNDNLVNLLCHLEDKNFHMGLFYEKNRVYILSDYGIKFAENCVSEKLSEYIPACKLITASKLYGDT